MGLYVLKYSYRRLLGPVATALRRVLSLIHISEPTRPY